MGPKLLFVCTGNTCRSPLAEGMARAMFGDLVQVSSAGIDAWDGDKVSTHVVKILKEQNVDISQHGARRVSYELMADADWIIPMTQAQEEGLKRRFPQCIHKIRRLGDWGDGKRDILDPWMGSLEVYRQTAQEIRELLTNLKRQLLTGNESTEKKA
ncbi:low molecular weight protein arginine phosphatase [Desulfosporosinus sp.]|uniref:low molecular weight protein arginine phosphatase n=1 Tax=Desulfosporosinus sp. TaxID=157907 RepID=UPI00231B759F|nr:low molecular weight protein arginine phosphatase [Desulfosporosinus sp.]MCO5386158.1 low molecular weight protein arginine phosphatase [Desulfosporosinus sp.]MDA8220469.1 low molecular weight protein arginine phosphatase [Desulfitobacterium hafniense]